AAFRKCFALGERNLGREFAQAQAAAGDSNEALKLLREVVLEHEDAEAWTALACLLLDAKDRAAASAALSRSVTLEPASSAALGEGLERHPASMDLRSELIVSIFEGGEVVRARKMLDTLLAEQPANPRAIAAMAGMLNVEGQLQEAEKYARRALVIDPSDAIAHQNLGVTFLKQFSFADGWDHYEWRTKVDELASVYNRFAYPVWEGASLAGKTVLVYAEQGLGDEIMFASCIPDLMRQARQVVLECNSRLGPIFTRSFAGCAVFARERTETNAWARSLEPQPDFQVPIGSLPRHF